MLPAWCSTQTSRHDSSRMTVVVNPTVSLQEDLNRCCRAAGLQCVMWNPRHPHTKVSIMLVTVESAVTAGFITFLNRVHAIHCLNRIVIDECHAVFDGGAEFRPKLRSLPPTEESSFCEIMRLPASQMHVYVLGLGSGFVIF